MKNNYLLPVVLFFVVTIFFTFSVNQANSQTPSSNPVKQDTVKYTCPMHPEVIKNEPGKCPKCGMTLVIKKDKKKSEMKCDSIMMKQCQIKMKHDSTSMKKRKMMQDTMSMKHKKMVN